MQTTRKIFNNSHFSSRFGHGGILAQGKRKSRRPLSMNKPMLVSLTTAPLQSRHHLQERRNSAYIREILQRQAKKFKIQLLEEKISFGSLELMLRVKQREQFQQFLRSVTALIARKISGARKGHKFGKFWLGLAYSLVIRGRESFQELLSTLKSWIEERRALEPFLRL